MTHQPPRTRRHKMPTNTPSYCKSLEDRLQHEATQAAANELFLCIKMYLSANPSMPLRNLTMDHLMQMADNCITGWVLKRNQQELNDPIDDIGQELDIFA
jgi:hypothetical protein